MSGHVNYLLNWVKHFKENKPEIDSKKSIDKYCLKPQIYLK